MSDALEYPFGNNAQLAQAELLRTGVYRLAIPLPGALSMEHINTWIVDEGDSWSLVDCGYDFSPARQAWQGLERTLFAKKPVNRIVVTHHHVDHSGLAGWLSNRYGAAIYMAEAEFNARCQVFLRQGLWSREEGIDFFERAGLTAVEYETVANWLEFNIQGFDRPIGRYRTLDGLDHLSIGEHAWQVITVRGHSPAHTCLYCENLGVLVAGDNLLPSLAAFVGIEPGDSLAFDPLGRFLSDVKQLKELPADTLVLPAHGAPFIGLHNKLEQVEQHYRALLEKVLCACAEPSTVMAITRRFFPERIIQKNPFFTVAKVAAVVNHLLAQRQLEWLPGSEKPYLFRGI